MQEQWRPIPGYEGHYEISDLGQVRSIDRLVDRGNRRMRLKGRILKPEQRCPDGGRIYYVVKLSKDGIVSKWYVHILVLTIFRGECPEGQEGCHNNGISTDNRLENLRWDTHIANVHDAIEHGTFRSIRSYNGDKTHCHRGHPFDEINTKIRPEGRACRECARINERARYRRREPVQLKDRDHPNTHCPRGHLFDEANTYVRPNGKWNCIKCRRLAANAWYRRQKD
jgi:hypothetical protein